MSDRDGVYAAVGWMAVVAVVIAVLGILAAGWFLGSQLVDGLAHIDLVAVR